MAKKKQADDVQPEISIGMIGHVDHGTGRRDPGRHAGPHVRDNGRGLWFPGYRSPQ